MTGPKQGRRIIHFTSSLSRSGGGIPPVIWSLAQNTQALGSESMVTGLKDEFFETDCRSRSVQVIAGKVRGPRAVGYSPELGRLMGSQIRSTDVVHSHGLWMYPGALAFQLSQRTGCKRVVSPHGMLEPWALQNSRWKKRTAGWLFEKGTCERQTACMPFAMPKRTISAITVCQTRSPSYPTAWT